MSVLSTRYYTKVVCRLFVGAMGFNNLCYGYKESTRVF